MKAMNLTGIRQMEMMNVPDPAIVNDNDVLIKLGVIAVCGSDVHYYVSGKIGSQVVQYPFPVGHECAGVVEKVGNAVKTVKPGDRIAIEPAMHCGKCDQCLAGRPHTCRNIKFLGCPGQANGSLSEYIVMPESSCYPIPEHMSLDEAAISEPLAIGLYAVKQSIDMKNAKVGILGFGPIGMSVLLSAKAYGAEDFFVTDKVNDRLKTAEAEGANIVGNPDNEDIVKKIKQKEQLGLDVVFECCGQQDAIYNAVNLLKPGGKIMIIGIPEFDTWHFPVDKLRHKEISIVNVRRQNHCVDETLELLASGKVDVSRMPTHRFKFEDTKKAFDLVDNYEDGVMKAMVDFD
jgi:L-iditol 2-dehydrogenase